MNSKKPYIFNFKRFSLKHEKSAMKIGVDGVLLGAWGKVTSETGTSGVKILDVGCGCGLLGFMAAQRNPDASITMIDIDGKAVEEARENLSNLPFDNKFEIKGIDFEDFCKETENLDSYDCILSNPPFFHSGIINPATSREKARHAAGLSPMCLVNNASVLLKTYGTLSLIALADDEPELIYRGEQGGLYLTDILRIRNNPDVKPHRVLMNFRKGLANSVYIDAICIRNRNGMYNERYIELTKDFYLNLLR